MLDVLGEHLQPRPVEIVTGLSFLELLHRFFDVAVLHVSLVEGIVGVGCGADRGIKDFFLDLRMNAQCLANLCTVCCMPCSSSLFFSVSNSLKSFLTSAWSDLSTSSAVWVLTVRVLGGAVPGICFSESISVDRALQARKPTE